MPKSKEVRLRAVNEFKQVAGFPALVGAIDGLHIPTIVPSADEHACQAKDDLSCLHADYLRQDLIF